MTYVTSRSDILTCIFPFSIYCDVMSTWHWTVTENRVSVLEVFSHCALVSRSLNPLRRVSFKKYHQTALQFCVHLNCTVIQQQ